MSFRTSLSLLALAGACGQAAADPVLWFSDSGGRLGTVDIATGNATLVGAMGVQMTDIAFSPTGDLYGTTFSSLYRIDSATAAVTFVGNHFNDINALVFGADGTLYGAGGALFTYNTATGAGTLIGNMGASSSGDLAFVGGELFLAAAGGDTLRKVSTSTGASTLVGNIGRQAVYGLASPNGVDLYGMAGSTVFAINPVTGAAGPNLVSFDGFTGTFGTTFFEEARPPIPEPASYGLMALGLLGVGAMARRRRG